MTRGCRRTQMYTERCTSDANLVSGPRSHLFTEIQNICRRTTSSASSTHKYDGPIAASIVKNMITRHESRRPSPKATGPNVPAENLRMAKSRGSPYELSAGKRHTHDKMFAFAENHIKKILMKRVSVLSLAGTGRIPIEQQVCE